MKKTLLLILATFYCGISFSQITIGTGTNESQTAPVEPYYEFSYSQSIYLQSEIFASGTITTLSYFYSGTSDLSSSDELVDIWIGHTNKSSFSSTTDWEDVSGMTQVFSGTIPAPTSPGTDEWLDIDITDFVYNNVDNLIIAVDANEAGYNSSNDDFHNSSVSGSRTLTYYSDTTNPDPTLPPTASDRVTYIPNIILGGIVQTCSPPTASQATNVTANSADISWTDGIGCVSNYTVAFSPADDAGGPISCGTEAYSATGLSASTTYTVTITGDCVDLPVHSFMFTTTPEDHSTCALAETLVLDFNCAGTSGGLNEGDPTGFDNTDGNVCNTNYSTGDDFIYEYVGTGNYLNLELYGTNTYSGIMVTEGCPTTGTCVASSGSATSDESLTTPVLTVGTTYYIHISTWTAPQSIGQFCLNASETVPPSCSAAESGAAANITDNSADLSWTDGIGCVSNYTVAFSPADDTGGPISCGTEAYSATGLTASTTYTVTITNDCTGSPDHTFTFTTSNAPPPAPVGVSCTTPGTNSAVVYTEEMDAQGSWTGDFGTSDGQWDFATSASGTGSTSTGPDNPHSGSGWMFYEASGSTTATASAVSPSFDLTSISDDAELSFWMHAYGQTMGTLNVGVSTSASGPFTTVFTWSGELQTGESEAYVPVGIDVSSFIGGDLYVEFSHTGAGDFNGDMSIDLVEVTACVSCSAPSAGAASNITDMTADLSWTDGVGCSTNNTISFSPADDAGGTVSCGTETYAATGLTELTTYTVTIANDCGSMPTHTFMFTTPAAPLDYCGADNFTDSGGAASNYASSENMNWTICPDNPTDKVSITFNTFEVEGNGSGACYDKLYIYDGPDNSATDLSPTDGFCYENATDGTSYPGGGLGVPIVSSHAGGCLHFEFTSDGSVQFEGWDAEVTCAPYSDPATTVVLAPSGSTTMTASNAMAGSNGYTYYEDPSNPGTYLFAVNWDAAGNGNNDASDVTITIDNAAADGTADDGGDNATWTMKRYWNVDMGTGILVDPVDLKFFYDAAEKAATEAAATSDGRPVEASAWFKTPAGTVWNNVPAAGNPVLNPIELIDANDGAGLTENGTLYAEFQGVPSFSGGSFASGVGAGANSLPAELLSFRGVTMKKGNKLMWETASEENTQVHILERSSDGTNWREITRVDAIRFSTNLNEYEAMDSNPIAKAYYRLQTLDFDGQYEYSNIINLTRNTIADEISIYPNPAGMVINVDYVATSENNVRYDIYNMSGKLVQSIDNNGIQKGLNSKKIDISSLTSGMYMLKVNTSTGTKLKRFVKE